MNKLTPVFIAGAIAVSAGLAFAQSRIATAPQPDRVMEMSHDAASGPPKAAASAPHSSHAP